MGDYTEMVLDGVICESCGCFIEAEFCGYPRKCEECHEDELIEAVETDIIPDGMTHMQFLDIKKKYSEPELAYRE